MCYTNNLEKLTEKAGEVMLQLNFGLDGETRKKAIYDSMGAQGKERPQYLIVPEQQSYETEHSLCDIHGDSLSSFAEVFSFTSLSRRVRDLFGGNALVTLDEGGRVLLLYKALKELKSGLTVLDAPAKKTEFLGELLGTIDELKAYCVTGEKLYEMAELYNGLGAEKLKDMALIYSSYTGKVEEGFADPRDRLTQLAEQLEGSNFPQNKDFYLEGFLDFTPQELLVIEKLLVKGNSLTVSLNTEDLSEISKDFFLPAWKTAMKLKSMAEKNTIPVREVNIAPNSCGALLDYLLPQLLSAEDAAPFEGETESLSIHEFATAREEVDFVAREMRKLAQSGVRYRDMAVIARNIGQYEEIFRPKFSAEDIPYFYTKMEAIGEKPICHLVRSIFSVMVKNFAYEDVFRYLKSGLSPLSPRETDILENYVLLWKIEGRDWLSGMDFKKHPRGYGLEMTSRDESQLAYINMLRRKVILPYINFKKSITDTINSKVIALYSFFEEIHLAAILERRGQAFLDQGEPALCQEYQQLWNIVLSALDQFVSLLGEEKCDLEEFQRLLELLFSQYKVGTVPLALDRAMVGESSRLAGREVPYLFFMGLREDIIPQVTAPQGLFTQEDREFLQDFGVDLSPDIDSQLGRERMQIHMLCGCAKEKIYLSYPKENEGKPAFFLDKLLSLAPHCFKEVEIGHEQHSKTYLMDEFAKNRKFSTKDVENSQLFHYISLRRRGKTWKSGDLSTQSVENLYGKDIKLSASRMDKLQECPFAHFAQYGLRAKKRQTAGFDAPAYGTFVHYVLERILKSKKDEVEWENLPLAEETEKAVGQYKTEHFVDFSRETQRFQYLFSRLAGRVESLCENVVKELQHSDFKPTFFELGFGKGAELPAISFTHNDVTLEITGYIDRVDTWTFSGKTYLKIVDYKTGRKSFDFTEISHGIGLQMILYLFALKEEKDALNLGELEAAGLLYLPTRDVIVSGERDMSESEREREVSKELKRKGLLLNEEAVLYAMEHVDAGEGDFLPMKRNKNGDLVGDSLVSKEQLNILKDHVTGILREICEDFPKGDISPKPYWRSENQNACNFCDFRPVCHFEEGLFGGEKREIHTCSAASFWADKTREGESDETN